MTAVYSRLNQALAGCEKTLSLSNDWYEDCVRVSNILISMGRFDEASQWHTMAIEETPDVSKFHAKAAFLYVIQERWDDAISWYTKLLELDPQYTEAHRHLAQIYSRTGQIGQEIEHWYDFLTHNPKLGTPDGHHKLGQSFQEQGNLKRAASCYERAIALQQTFWPPYYALANVRKQQNRWEDAAHCYEQLIQQDDNQVEAHYQIGRVWLHKKQYDRAITKFRDINARAPQFPSAYLGLTQAFIALEQWDKVINTCQTTIIAVEELPWAYKHMGRAFMQQGEEQQAIDCYQKAATLLDWIECQKHDYHFIEDTFSHQIPSWRKQLQPLIEAQEVVALTIGSQDGMVPCWLLDTVLTHPSDELMCVDQAFSSRFDRNINQTDALDKIVCMEGPPLSLLPDLPTQTFDLIVIQDRRKQSDYIFQEMELCWPLLNPEGLVIVKGYGWQHPSGPDQSPKAGVNRFLAQMKDEVEVLVQDYQLIAKKRAIAPTS